MDSIQLYDKVVKDEIDIDVKGEILKLLEKLNKIKEAKLATNRRYLDKIKDDDVKKDRIRVQKNEYYKNNKDTVNEKLREKYKNNKDYQYEKKKTTLELYHMKNDNTPKMKRGRKPIPEEDKKIKVVTEPKQRGRPRKLVVID